MSRTGQRALWIALAAVVCAGGCQRKPARRATDDGAGTSQLVELQRILPELETRQVVVVAISVDPLEVSESLAASLGLGFRLASDPAHAMRGGGRLVDQANQLVDRRGVERPWPVTR